MGRFRSKIGPLGEVKATENKEPLKPTGRAGRNLPAAFAVGIIAASVSIGLLIITKIGFAAFVVACLCLAQYELARAFKRADITIALPPLWMGTIGMGVCAYQLGAEATLGALGVTILALVIWQVSDGWSIAAFKDVFVSAFSLIYVGFMGTFVILMLVQTPSYYAMLVWIAATVSNDIGGYAMGVLFGKHPMAPKVSPSKSWEGFAGSTAMCMASTAVGLYLMGLPWWAGVIQGFFTAVVATLGDLGESLIKRDVGLKDMGHLLPGHGGIMDRMDSLLLTAPLFYIFFTKVLTL